MNLTDDGMVGQQVFAGEATRLAYMTDEAKEGRNAFLENVKNQILEKISGYHNLVDGFVDSCQFLKLFNNQQPTTNN